MLSITSHMDERDIAQEVVMERMVHKGSFLVLEGKTDIKRFRSYVDKNRCSMVNCQSVTKAVGAMQCLEKRKFPGVLAIVDADFTRIQGLDRSKDDIVVSEFHDLDLDWIKTGALEKYLSEVADETKVASKGGCEGISESIHATLRPISAGKLLNRRKVFKFKTSGINVGKIYTSGVDLCKTFAKELASEGYVDGSQVDWIVSEIRNEMTKQKDDWQMTNGHDFCGALGAMLQSEIGKKKIPQTYASEVEGHIRLAFNWEDFQSLKIYSDIVDWENKNEGYKIVREN